MKFFAQVQKMFFSCVKNQLKNFSFTVFNWRFSFLGISEILLKTKFGSVQCQIGDFSKGFTAGNFGKFFGGIFFRGGGKPAGLNKLTKLFGWK